MDTYTFYRLLTGAALGWFGGFVILYRCRHYWKIRVAKKDGLVNWLLLGMALPILWWSFLYTLMLLGIISQSTYPPLAQFALPILELAVILVAMRV